MNQSEAANVAKTLLEAHGDHAFEMSMPDQAGYDLMRKTFESMGRPTNPDGEFFVIKVSSASVIARDVSGAEFPTTRAA